MYTARWKVRVPVSFDSRHSCALMRTLRRTARALRAAVFEYVRAQPARGSLRLAWPARGDGVLTSAEAAIEGARRRPRPSAGRAWQLEGLGRSFPAREPRGPLACFGRRGAPAPCLCRSQEAPSFCGWRSRVVAGAGWGRRRRTEPAPGARHPGPATPARVARGRVHLQCAGRC